MLFVGAVLWQFKRASNLPRMVFSNYRELVRPADAKKWFAIEPKADDKVMPMPKAEEAAAVA